MFLDRYDITVIIAASITAFIIKLLDDYIDLDQSGFSHIVDKMGKGILPYSLILFSLSCLINREVTISLLAAAYIIGMTKDLNRELSFKLKGYHESVIILIIFGLFLGIYEMVSSLIIIFIIQLLDDIIDLKKDKYYNNKNLAINFGIVEVCLSSLIFFLVSIKIDLKKTLICIIIFILFQAIEFIIYRGEREWIS